MGAWSKAKPIEEGFYWYRSRCSNVARVCHVDSNGYVSFTDGVVREVSRLRGEWSWIEYPKEAGGREGYPRYTVRRCSREGFIYGSHHGSVNGSETLCGLVLGGGYYITHNEFDGPVTCRKCLEEIRGQA